MSFTNFSYPVKAGENVGNIEQNTLASAVFVREITLDASESLSATYKFPKNAFLLDVDALCTTAISATNGVTVDVGNDTTADYYASITPITTVGRYASSNGMSETADELESNVVFTMSKVNGADTLNSGVVKLRLIFSTR